MNTNRIRFIDENESAYLPGGQTAINGFTVVKAPRGRSEPVLFPKGSSQAIKARIGSPSSTFPDIQEAIEFNNSYSLYISAPPGIKTGLVNYYGGIYLTTEKSVENFYKVIDPEFPNFQAEIFAGNTASAFSNGTTKTYVAQKITIGNIDNDYFDHANISGMYITYPSILDPDVTTTVKLKLGAGNTILIDDQYSLDIGDIIDNLDGTSKIEIVGSADPNSVFDLTFEGDLDTHLTANFSSLTFSWIYDIEEFVVQTFYQNSPRETQTTFNISKIDLDLLSGTDDNPYYNTLTFTFKETVNGVDEYQSSNLTISTDIDAVDGYNQSLYYENVFSEKTLWYIGSTVYKQYTDINGVYVVPINKVVSGTRVFLDSTMLQADIDASLQEGWEELTDPSFENLDICFDNSGVAELKTYMATLRNQYMKTTTFLSPIKSTLSDTTSALADIIAARATAPKTLGGLGYTCNEFLIKDSLGKEYWSPIVGSVAVAYAQIMTDKLGGVAPMFTNDGSGLGGQLNRSVRKQKYKFSADHLDDLDETGVNPIILDTQYGLMLTSQKTAANPLFLTDWSFFGHSMAFDILKREIKKDVLVPQIGKAISTYYLELRQSQTEAIVNKRLQGATAIWTDAKVLVNDETVNNDETKMMNKFVVKVRVKVTPFSEYVEFILNNVSQTTTL